MTNQSNYISSLGAGLSEVTYNARRNILGSISHFGKIALHIFSMDNSSSNQHNPTIKLLKKAAWDPQYYTTTSTLL